MPRPCVPTWLGVVGLPGALVSLWLRSKLVALPGDPAKLLSQMTGRARLRDFRDKLSLRHQFGREFGEVCQALRTRTSPGLVILIDDLDRCRPGDVLDVLEAVNYFVSTGACFVVLGMDRRQVEHCVGLGFKDVVEGLPSDELLFAAGETDDATGRRRAFARHYLEKLINIEVPVPDLRGDQAAALLVPEQAARGVDEPAPWVGQLKVAWASGYQVARVAVLAAAAGLLSVVALEGYVGPRAPESPPERTLEQLVQQTQGQGAMPAEPAASISEPPERTPEAPIEPAAGPPIVFETVTADDLREPWRWAWWGATALAVAVAAFWGVGAAVTRERLVVRDSPAFKRALARVHPLVHAANATPRGINRYQNRMRYLAMRLRPVQPETDAVDEVLHRLGGRMGRELVPASWFAPPEAPELAEPKLILLGAVEVFDPQAIERPAERVFDELEEGLKRTEGSPEGRHRRDLWAEFTAGFRREFPDGWLRPTEVRLYQGFLRPACGGQTAADRPAPTPVPAGAGTTAKAGSGRAQLRPVEGGSGSSG